MKKYIFTFISILFIGSSLYLGKEIYNKMDTFKRYKQSVASELNLQTTVTNISNYISSNSFETKKQEAQRKIKKANAVKSKANYLSLLFLVGILIYSGLTYFFFRIKSIEIKHIGYAVLNISFVLLLFGIFIPILELGIFMQDLTIDLKIYSKTFDGKMYFLYQCKSLVGVIKILFQNHNFGVGIAILLFSVIFPFTKLGIFYMYLFTDKLNTKTRILNIVSYIGKYSMADVFVVATFLAFFSFSNMSMGAKTESTTLVGLYFFTGYCILSIATYFVIEKKMKETKEIKSVTSLDDLI